MKQINIIDEGKIVIMMEATGLMETVAALSDDFEHAINLLCKVKGHVITSGMGKPGHIARKISATLASTGTKSFFLHPAEASHGDLGEISQDDVLLVLSLSGETSELMPMLSYAKRFGIPIVSITGNTDSSLAKVSEVVLKIPQVKEACPNNLAPTTSSAIMLALGDAIAVCLLELRDFSKDDFKQLHPGGMLGKKLLKAEDLMHKELPLVQESDNMGDVLIKMTSMAFGCAGVINSENHLTGIITDGDLRRHIPKGDIMQKKAIDIMTYAPITASADAFASEVIKTMNARSITSVFIVDKNNLPVGILHIHDCLRAGLA